MTTPPTVGRIVHLHSEVGEVRAAIVTAAHENGYVDLTVFERSSLPTTRCMVPFGEWRTGNGLMADYPPRV